MAFDSVSIITRGQLLGNVITKENASKVKFTLESTSRGESVL